MSDAVDRVRNAAREIPLVRDHARTWRDNRYVYPVISRRAGGLSIGINLSPSKACNFHCVYCQVNRRCTPVAEKVDSGSPIGELNAMLDWVVSGQVWQDPHFAGVPKDLRRLNDIAFSGDGEPTLCRDFPNLVRLAGDARDLHRLKDVKIIVITNATRLHTQAFQRALPLLRDRNGEVWAKLDAGSAEHFTRVHRGSVPFKAVLANIESLAQVMPVVIQSCFFRLDGEGPSETEIELYIARLRHILEVGGRLKFVQVYSIARSPAEPSISALPDEELDAIAGHVRHALEDVPVATYYGADVQPQQPDSGQ